MANLHEEAGGHSPCHHCSRDCNVADRNRSPSPVPPPPRPPGLGGHGHGDHQLPHHVQQDCILLVDCPASPEYISEVYELGVISGVSHPRLLHLGDWMSGRGFRGREGGGGANCIEAIALRLRNRFMKYKGTVLAPVLDRLKEKKQGVLDALSKALAAIFKPVCCAALSPSPGCCC